MKKIFMVFISCILLMLSGCNSTKKEENKPALEKEVLKAFEKNKELTNYHMKSVVNEMSFDVNIENIGGQQNMAGSVIYNAEILSHKDGSVVDTREVREFLYKRGDSTMIYRELDGLDQFDVNFENLEFYEEAQAMIVNQVDEAQVSENITLVEKDDGSKEYIYAKVYHFIVNKEGYMISYSDNNGNSLAIDNINSVVLDFTYSKI